MVDYGRPVAASKRALDALRQGHKDSSLDLNGPSSGGAIGQAQAEGRPRLVDLATRLDVVDALLEDVYGRPRGRGLLLDVHHPADQRVERRLWRLRADVREADHGEAPGPDVGGGGIAGSEERRVGKECRSRWSPYH